MRRSGGLRRPALRRRLPLVLAATSLAAAAALAPLASASQVRVDFRNGIWNLSYVAGPEDNDVTIRHEGASYRITDRGVSTITAYEGCVAEGNTALCAGADVALVDVWAHRGDNVIDASALTVRTELKTADGSDVIRGGRGRDSIHGGFFYPTEPVSPGTKDVLYGGDGDDWITGGAEPTVVDAGDGDDYLEGGGGADALHGGPGTDDLHAGAGGLDLLDGGPGDDDLHGHDASDYADYSARSQPVRVDFDGVADDGEPGEGDALIGLASVRGGEGDDVLVGDDRQNHLDGGPGSDTMIGGEGDDFADYGSRREAVVVSLDGVDDDGAPGEADSIALDVEGIIGGRGEDELTGPPASGSDLFGGGGDDILRLLEPGFISGGGGDDLLVGSRGSDVFWGDAGVDTVDYSSRTAPVAVRVAGGDDGEEGEHDRLFWDVEGVRGGAGNDRLTGTHVANALDGGPGDDVLAGGRGDDSLVGGAGTDTITGGTDDDAVAARNGDLDSVDCEAGEDTIAGNAGDVVSGCERTSTAPALRVGDVTGDEGTAGIAGGYRFPPDFAILLSEPSEDPVTVRYETAPASASSDADFVPAEGTLRFRPGETLKLVSVELRQDAEFEADETFEVRLLDAQGAAVDDGTARGTIVNDDPLPYRQLVVKMTGSDGAEDSAYVWIEPSGDSCPFICRTSLLHGTEVTLRVQTFNAEFTGWGGACAGASPTCALTLRADTEVTAGFRRPDQRLAVHRYGAGRGRIISTPLGIDCADSCSRALRYGREVELTAVPAPGSTFSGWGGDCVSTGPCTVTMTQARDVFAIFAVPERAPSTTITRGPARSSPSRSATFRFRADVAARFQCRIDRWSWRACNSPWRVRWLRRGRHVFWVRAVAASGLVDPTPARWAWRIR